MPVFSGVGNLGVALLGEDALRTHKMLFMGTHDSIQARPRSPPDKPPFHTFQELKSHATPFNCY